MKNVKILKSVTIIFSFYALTVIGISLLPAETSHEIIRENGLVEMLSSGGYFFFCLLLLYYNIKGNLKTSLAPGLIVFLLGLRELDFHEKFTTMGMFKIKFFISPDVPLLEKIIVIGFIAILAVYGGIYFKQTLPGFKKALLAGKTWSVFVFCGISCAFFSKLLLDGNSKMLAILFPFVDNPDTFFVIMEECMELLIPVFFILGLVDIVKKKTLPGNHT